MRDRRTIVVGCLCAVLAACGGGSGSTGLVTSEDAILDQVRESGTCDQFRGASYCATDSPDAVAPGGERVSVVTPVPTAAATATSVPSIAPTPVPTATSEPSATPTPEGESTSTPASTGGVGRTATPGFPTPEPTATLGPTPSRTEPAATPSLQPSPTAPAPTPTPARTVTAVVAGFAPGAACATAARPAGTAEDWRTAALVAVAINGPTTFPISPDPTAPIDLTLLCFADPPAQLAATLVTLGDADPTVVFVLPGS